ncbi:MAG: hypothetical protein ACM3SO_05025 [Betaproteobacteria bacterium]
MTRFSFGWFGVAAIPAILATVALVAGCGSGAVGNPPNSTSAGPITITPSTATLFSDLPSTFFISGGNGNYIVASSNQAALRVSGTFAGNELVVIPNQVVEDTPLTLTVTDTASNTPAIAQITVKPRTVNNVLTIRPSATQPASCGTALCAGGDAEVKAVLTQGGLPLQQRAVKFEVLQGDIRVITSPVGVPETLAISTTTATDNTGTATVRIRALATAPAQTALLQVTDLGSGFIQRASVTIAGTSGSPLAASPGTVTFQGLDTTTCATDITADVIVSGGRPPYNVSQPASFQVSPLTVTENGGRFSITAKGQCTAGTTIAVVDSAGASVAVTVVNKVADAITLPTFSVSPATVTLTSCNDKANVILIGGTGNYFATSRVGAVAATVTKTSTGAIGTITRVAGTPGTSSVTVSFSDGRTVKDVVVTLTGTAVGSCDNTSNDAVVATPSKVTISSCSDSPTVVISGGTGNYTARPSSSGITVTPTTFTSTNNILSISRSRTAVTNPPTPPTPISASPCPGTFTPGANQCVAVSDGISSALIDVIVTGAAASGC